jgi:hypothetical protein
MSYDLAVFDPRSELRDRAVFENWYDERTEWDDGLDYNDPTNATPALQAWLLEIRQRFVPMNGPFAPEYPGEKVGELTADYTIARDLIYVAFSWSDVETAYATCIELAKKHRVGFLDASGDEGAAWFPSSEGAFEIVHTAPQEESDA